MKGSAVLSIVMAGLDPAIHDFLVERRRTTRHESKRREGLFLVGSDPSVSPPRKR